MENRHDSDVVKAVAAWRKSHPDFTTKCQICGSTDWATGIVCELPDQMDGTPFPVIPLRCTHCSNVMFLAALQVMKFLNPEA